MATKVTEHWWPLGVGEVVLFVRLFGDAVQTEATSSGALVFN